MSEIYSRLVDHTITNTNEINDFSVGSAMRAIYESIAIELEQFYILTKENIEEAIAQGVYESFGFTRKKATRAYGVVVLEFHNATQRDLVISRGTRFSSNLNEYPQDYETLVDYVIPKGSLRGEVQVYCTTTGEVGNVPARVINVMNSPLINLKEVYNPQAIQTGQDEEPLEEMRARFRSYLETLSRATVAALEYGTREVEEVSGVYIDEKTGYITVYAHDRNGNLPEDVKRKIEENLYYYRPAGIPVRVLPVTRKPIDINAVITVTNQLAITNRLRNSIQMEITRYLNNMRTSQDLILADLIRVIMNIDSQLIYDVEITNLNDNVRITGNEIIRAGEVTVKLQ